KGYVCVMHVLIVLTTIKIIPGPTLHFTRSTLFWPFSSKYLPLMLYNVGGHKGLIRLFCVIVFLRAFLMYYRFTTDDGIDIHILRLRNAELLTRYSILRLMNDSDQDYF